MPTKARRQRPPVAPTVTVQMPEAEELHEEKTEQETEAEEVIEQAVGELSKSPEAYIYRTSPDTGKEAFLDRVSASTVSMEWLAREYGGGRYRVQFRRPNEKGKMVYHRQEVIEVDPSIPSRAPKFARTLATGPVMEADGRPAGGSRMDAIVESGVLALFQQMQTQSNVTLQLFKEMAETKRESRGPDTGAIVQLVGALAPVLTSVVGLLTSRVDPITKAREIAELAVGNKEKAAGGLGETLAGIKAILELRDVLTPPSAELADPATAMLTAMAPQLMEIIRAEQAAKQRGEQMRVPRGPVPPAASAPVPQPQRAGVSPAALPNPPATEDVAPMPLWRIMLAPYVPTLAQRAAQGKSPALMADVMLEDIPEQYLGMVADFVEQPNVDAMVCEAFPELRAHRAWMASFLATVREGLSAEEEGDETGEDVTGAEPPGVDRELHDGGAA